MDKSLQISQYQKAAGFVRRRVAGFRVAASIRRSHVLAGLGVAILVCAARIFGDWRSGELLLAASLLVVWLAAVALVSLARLPGPEEALLLLDRAGRWKDCFSSAWEFLNRPVRSAGEDLHLDRAKEMLPPALDGFPGVLPIPSLKWAWILPLAALLFAATPWLRTTPDSREMKLTERMTAAAAVQAEELRREADRLSGLAALNEEEKGQLELLRVDVAAAADKLASAEGLTAGEILASLEERARAAEKLAESLGSVSEEWASPEMLAEMDQHPDTADLGLLIRDKAAPGAGEESMRLSGLLGDSEIKEETAQRVTRALSDIVRAAVEEDFVRPVGERFGNASTKMADSQPKTAAREFEELARHFRDLAGREEARSKLEQLAESLREAGLEISGSELQRIDRLAAESGRGEPATEGLQPVGSEAGGTGTGGTVSQQLARQGQKAGDPALPPAMQPASEGSPESPFPGAAPGQGEGGQGESKGEQTFSAPIPGESPQDGQSGSGIGMSEKSRDGSGEGGILSAPVPGMDPGQSAPGAGMSLGEGSSSSSTSGGDQAGTGTAEMVDTESAATKASGDAEVIAQAGEGGDSTFRSIEGGVRPGEKAGRSRQELITDFLAAEEQALDEQSLPMSRRGHVLRYFSEIRRQFEKPENE